MSGRNVRIPKIKRRPVKLKLVSLLGRTILLVTEVSPQFQEDEMSRDNLMYSINQEVSDGNTRAQMRNWFD